MPAPLVFDFIGSVFTAILYGKYWYCLGLDDKRTLLGFYCMIFGLYWRIQLKRVDRWKGVLLYPLTAIFILCTVYFIIITIQTQFLITVSPSSTSRKLFFRCHGSQYERRSADFRIPRYLWSGMIHWKPLSFGCPSQMMQYMPPSTSFRN